MAGAKPTKRALPSEDAALVILPTTTVAVVHSSGDPNDAGPGVMKALYGAAYGLKFALKKRGIEVRLDYPRARWDFHAGADPGGDHMAAGLDGDWALPVPDGTTTADLPQKSEEYPVSVQRWEYGQCAWILHLGPYSDEPATVERLAAFIDSSGLEIAGRHEEWYLSQPSAKVMKTAILYPVRPKTA
jgi:hypothetical protein